MSGSAATQSKGSTADRSNTVKRPRSEIENISSPTVSRKRTSGLYMPATSAVISTQIDNLCPDCIDFSSTRCQTFPQVEREQSKIITSGVNNSISPAALSHTPQDRPKSSDAVKDLNSDSPSLDAANMLKLSKLMAQQGNLMERHCKAQLEAPEPEPQVDAKALVRVVEYVVEAVKALVDTQEATFGQDLPEMVPLVKKAQAETQAGANTLIAEVHAMFVEAIDGKQLAGIEVEDNWFWTRNDSAALDAAIRGNKTTLAD